MESQNENKYYVYAISDPVNRIPFYIGKGCKNRAYQHLKCKENNKEKNKIIKLLLDLNIVPRIDFIAENLEEKTAYDIEHAIIKNSIFFGIKLTNKVGLRIPPSRKNCKVSEETKRKISLSLKGKTRGPRNEETKRKLSIANKGKEGPNKKKIENIEQLKILYVDKNYKKEQICSFFQIGIGSLNRILKEQNIKKTAKNFSDYAKTSRKL